MPAFADFAGQSAHIARLAEEFSTGRFVHAYLFSGPKGTGKRSVARLCAMTALCRGAHKPCGVCGPCRRVLGETHPDVHTVLPEKGTKTLGVDALRGVLGEVATRSFEDGVKVMLVPEAERMTPAAQNCLLKTLEEPPEGTVFFLITDQPGALLATIVSRCRIVRFHPLSQKEAEARLVALGLERGDAARRARMAEGCVGQALAIDEAQLELRRTLTRDVFSVRSPREALAVVNQYKDDKERAEAALDVLECAVRDILLAQAGAEPLGGAGYDARAEEYARAVPQTEVLALAQTVTRARKMLGSNVAFASALEMILLKVAEEYTQWRW